MMVLSLIVMMIKETELLFLSTFLFTKIVI